MSSDARDLPAALAGDHDAFARLYARHAGIVLSLCRHHCSLDEAEDAMQEVFLRACRRLHQLNEPEGLRPWLYTIARRVCSERRRSAQRRQRNEARAIAIQTQARPDPPASADLAERTEQLERLTAAIDTLPENERLAVHLYYLEADPVEAASGSLGLSRSGFYKLLTRARHRLAFALRESQPI